MISCSTSCSIIRLLFYFHVRAVRCVLIDHNDRFPATMLKVSKAWHTVNTGTRNTASTINQRITTKSTVCISLYGVYKIQNGGKVRVKMKLSKFLAESSSFAPFSWSHWLKNVVKVETENIINTICMGKGKSCFVWWWRILCSTRQIFHIFTSRA